MRDTLLSLLLVFIITMLHMDNATFLSHWTLLEINKQKTDVLLRFHYVLKFFPVLWILWKFYKSKNAFNTCVLVGISSQRKDLNTHPVTQKTFSYLVTHCLTYQTPSRGNLSTPVACWHQLLPLTAFLFLLACHQVTPPPHLLPLHFPSDRPYLTSDQWWEQITITIHTLTL